MKNKIKFLYQFMKTPRQIGSIIPSSKNLRDAIVSSIDFSTDLCIFEYGPGDGIFTELIYSKMTPNSKLYIIENNLSFARALSIKYKECQNIEVINDTVENITNICKNRNIKNIDHIISGIPFLSLGVNLLEKVLSDSSILVSKSFILFQYTTKLEKYFLQYFINIEKFKIKNNLPPAYIYILYNYI